MKRYFHEELEAVRSHLMLMGEKAIESVEKAMRAILESDQELAEEVLREDDAIDEIETQIDEEVARYISLRAPVARDLRLLFVGIKASHDLERVGDEASSVAKRLIKILSSGHPIDDFGAIPRMCDLAISMLQDAMHCFIREMESRAFQISMTDREVDSLNLDNFQYFVKKMQSDPSIAISCTEMVFISKSFERIADHAKNIAEEVYFLQTTKSLKEEIKQQAGPRG